MDKQSPVPLYFQLAEQLERDIASGKYAPGDRIPSENELVRALHLGRPTVRQAIDYLVRKRLVLRKRGSGTYVAEPLKKVSLFSLGGTMASFASSSSTFSHHLLEQPQLIVVGSNPCNPFSGTSAIKVTRVTNSSHIPVLIEDIYLAPHLFDAILTMDITGMSLSKLVEESFTFVLHRCEQQFRVLFPNARIATLLATRKTDPVLAVSRYLHSRDTHNAIYSDLYCRSDEFVFSQTIEVRQDG
jgi:GntR family transcriptional regulator